MRIGIDGHVLGKNIGGVERYVEKVVALVADLLPQHEFVIFITRHAEARFADDRRPNVRFVTLRVADPLLQRSVVLPWAVRAHRLDVLQVQRIAPWACGACRIVLTIHDLIPIKYPQDYPGFRNRLIRSLTPLSVRQADLILSPTQSVCDDIRHHYPTAAAPCHPFYLGADPARFTRPDEAAAQAALHRHGITKPFIFSPGAIEARKNVEVIIEALAGLDPALRPDLLLSGSIRDAAYFQRLQTLATSLGVGASVRHLGFLSEPDLIHLYGCATLCIAASRDEGFNLLPLEAMACGTPVLCSDIPVHRELFTGGAGFFPPDDVDRLVSNIAPFLDGRSGRHAWAAGAEACLARLTWTAMAGRMAALFDGLDTRSASVEPGLRDFQSGRDPRDRDDDSEAVKAQ